jgi:outer membrane protein TolC
LNPEPLNAYIEKYFSGSPKIQIQLREIEIAEANLKVALKGHLPTFDLIAQIGRSNGENTYFTNTKNFFREQKSKTILI